MAGDLLLRMPFDHYARYRLAADVVMAVGATTALDIGGGPGSLQAFVPGTAVVASDLHPPSQWHEAAPALVIADGAQLPFATGAFECVVTLDTLEHVPPDRRAQLLADAVRASSGWLLIACPCATPGVAAADSALLAYVRRKFGEEFETVEVLTEHLMYGHPDPDQIESALIAAGAEVARFPSGRIDRWLPMMLLFYELMGLGVDDPVERVQAWYNDLYYRDDLRGPSYRQAFLCRLPGARGPSLDEALGALLPQGPPLAPDDGVFRALDVVLSNSLRTALANQRVRAESLSSELVTAQAEAATQRARAEAADSRVTDLEAFREQVLTHPVLRVRRSVRRLLGKRG